MKREAYVASERKASRSPSTCRRNGRSFGLVSTDLKNSSTWPDAVGNCDGRKFGGICASGGLGEGCWAKAVGCGGGI